MKFFTLAFEIRSLSRFESATLLTALFCWVLVVCLHVFPAINYVLDFALHPKVLPLWAESNNVPGGPVVLKSLRILINMILVAGTAFLAFFPVFPVPKREKELLFSSQVLYAVLPVSLLLHLDDLAVSGCRLASYATLFAMSVVAMYAGFRLYQNGEHQELRGQAGSGEAEGASPAERSCHVPQPPVPPSPSALGYERPPAASSRSLIEKVTLAFRCKVDFREALEWFIAGTAFIAWVLGFGVLVSWVDGLDSSWRRWPKVSVVLLAHVVVFFVCFLAPPRTVDIRSKWGFLPVSVFFSFLGAAVLWLGFERKSSTSDLISSAILAVPLFLMATYYRYCWMRLRVWETWDPKTKEWRLPREEMIEW
ncbi:MAG: hypothetical protein ACP5NF_11855 [Thermoanaerobaculum sp.]